jgi:hypothetical protein
MSMALDINTDRVLASVGMGNVFSKETPEQVITLGRLDLSKPHVKPLN